jgi:hypothetical protein
VPIASPPRIKKKSLIPGKILRVQTERIPSWTYSKADVYRGTTVYADYLPFLCHEATIYNFCTSVRPPFPAYGPASGHRLQFQCYCSRPI